MLLSLPFYFFLEVGEGGHIQQRRKNSTELEVNGNQLYQSCKAAEASAHAQYLITSVFNNVDLHDSSAASQSSDSSSLASVSVRPSQGHKAPTTFKICCS